MAKLFDVKVFRVNSAGKFIPKYDKHVKSEVTYDAQGLSVKIIPANFEAGNPYLDFTVCPSTECCRILPKSYLFTLENESLVLEFANEADFRKFHVSVTKVKSAKSASTFSVRTDDSSAMQYFQFYGYLSQQQNMLQDFIRTHTYQRAILCNIDDFKDKVVLDVGAGSGILSFFAIQAGAKKVYAVEASNMAHYAQNLVEANNLSDKIKVIAGKIEEIEIPEKVSVIISEPMGYMLFNERMLETYLHAKKWLLPNGKMYPSRGDLHIAPFTDDALYMEQYNKANFWYQTCFHGVDLSSMRLAAMKEYFRQPIVDTFDIRICLSKSVRHVVDFTEAHENDLHTIDIPLEFHILENGTCHGLAFWFDVAFNGCSQVIWLSTGPTEPLTHWYQVRCLLEEPLFVKQGQMLIGRVLLVANKRQSYDVTIELQVEGANSKSRNTLDLKNPYFRYTGAPVAPPPQVNITSPSENYWNQIDAQGARNGSSGTVCASVCVSVVRPVFSCYPLMLSHFAIEPTTMLATIKPITKITESVILPREITSDFEPLTVSPSTLLFTNTNAPDTDSVKSLLSFKSDLIDIPSKVDTSDVIVPSISKYTVAITAENVGNITLEKPQSMQMPRFKSPIRANMQSPIKPDQSPSTLWSPVQGLQTLDTDVQPGNQFDLDTALKWQSREASPSETPTSLYFSLKNARSSSDSRSVSPSTRIPSPVKFQSPTQLQSRRSRSTARVSYSKGVKPLEIMPIPSFSFRPSSQTTSVTSSIPQQSRIPSPVELKTPTRVTQLPSDIRSVSPKLTSKIPSPARAQFRRSPPPVISQYAALKPPTLSSPKQQESLDSGMDIPNNDVKLPFTLAGRLEKIGLRPLDLPLTPISSSKIPRAPRSVSKSSQSPSETRSQPPIPIKVTPRIISPVITKSPVPVQARGSRSSIKTQYASKEISFTASKDLSLAQSHLKGIRRSRTQEISRGITQKPPEAPAVTRSLSPSMTRHLKMSSPTTVKSPSRIPSPAKTKTQAPVQTPRSPSVLKTQDSSSTIPKSARLPTDTTPVSPLKMSIPMEINAPATVKSPSRIPSPAKTKTQAPIQTPRSPSVLRTQDTSSKIPRGLSPKPAGSPTDTRPISPSMTKDLKISSPEGIKTPTTAKSPSEIKDISSKIPRAMSPISGHPPSDTSSVSSCVTQSRTPSPTVLKLQRRLTYFPKSPPTVKYTNILVGPSPFAAARRSTSLDLPRKVYNKEESPCSSAQHPKATTEQLDTSTLPRVSYFSLKSKRTLSETRPSTPSVTKPKSRIPSPVGLKMATLPISSPPIEKSPYTLLGPQQTKTLKMPKIDIPRSLSMKISDRSRSESRPAPPTVAKPSTKLSSPSGIKTPSKIPSPTRAPQTVKSPYTLHKRTSSDSSGQAKALDIPKIEGAPSVSASPKSKVARGKSATQKHTSKWPVTKSDSGDE